MVNGVLLSIDMMSCFGCALGDASPPQVHFAGPAFSLASKATLHRQLPIVIVSACDATRDSPMGAGFIHLWLVSELQLAATRDHTDLQASRSVHVGRISGSRQANGRRHAQGQARVTCRAEVLSNGTLSVVVCSFCLIALMSRRRVPALRLISANFCPYCIWSFGKYPTLPSAAREAKDISHRVVLARHFSNREEYPAALFRSGPL